MASKKAAGGDAQHVFSHAASLQRYVHDYL